MAKILERIVKGEGAPLENDLWLKEEQNKLSLKAYHQGEWKTVAGGGGGGGSTEGAVSYSEPQELTEEQQMQARKNQGLYWKEEHTGIGEKETTQPESWSDTYAFYNESYTKQDFIEFAVGEGNFSGQFKVSDDAPAVSDLISVRVIDGDEPYDAPVVDSQYIVVGGNPVYIYQGEGFYAWYSWYSGEEFDPLDSEFIVVTSDNGVDIELEDLIHLDKGIYCGYFGSVPSADESTWEVGGGYSLNYNGETTVVDISKIPSEYVEAVAYTEQTLSTDEQMQARKNQGLYASESEGFIKSITWDGDTTGLTPVVIYGTDYYRISDFIDIGGLTAAYKLRYLNNYQQDSECFVYSSYSNDGATLMSVYGYNNQTSILFADNFENIEDNEQLPDSLDGIYVTSDFRELNYLDTISWDCNPDGRDQFTFTVDYDGNIDSSTYVKMADASDGILKKFTTSLIYGDTATAYGVADISKNFTELIIDSVDVERGGFLLQWTNQGPVLKSGYAVVAETENGANLFVLVDAVLTINGEDSEPKNGIYVNYYDGSSEPETTRSFSFLPYNKIYNKVGEEYLGVDVRAFDVEFFINQDQLIECNTSHSQIFNAIKNGRVIRAFLTDYSGNEILITSDIILKPAGG